MTGTGENQAKNGFDDYMAFLVYDSTLGVFSNGKFLALRSYHVVVD